ncbi:MAG: hypothetical protein P8L31_09580 [Pseudomonadales bacterium]|nr:hypothetical protein [Pseudomonadales bacterium]
MPESGKQSPDLGQRIAGVTYRTLKWGRDQVPPGIRTLLGIAFMIGGVFGFLPILGFWMLPLGAAFIALDIPPMRQRIDAWLVTLRAKAKGET